jgi:hypothetical protein
MHPSVASILQYFAHEHLPTHLQDVCRPFARLAAGLAAIPPSPELTVALRKLLEAKDAAVRASLPQRTPAEVEVMAAGWVGPTTARERVVLELAEIEDRLSRLTPFLGSPKFEALPAEQQADLREQEPVMRQYALILRRRLATWAE